MRHHRAGAMALPHPSWVMFESPGEGGAWPWADRYSVRADATPSPLGRRGGGGRVYYPCRAAGDPKSNYREYLSLDTNPGVALHGGKASGTFTKKITDSLATRAMGDRATVTCRCSTSPATAERPGEWARAAPADTGS